MRSEIPHFRGSASEDEEPRWEAYRALLQRTADSDPPPRPRAEARSFNPFTLEEAERAYADAAPKTGEEEAPLSFEPLEETQPQPRPREIFREEAPPRERWTFKAFSSRNGRLITATTAVTAGLVLAASVFPRQQTEPAAIIWDHTRPAGTAPAAAPAPARTPTAHNVLAKSTPARSSRRDRAAHRSTASARRRASASQCAAAQAEAQNASVAFAAKALQRVRQACGVSVVQETKPPIGGQTLNF